MKLMLSKANFLILDEPTNHLDMVSKEILEQALNHYTGTVFFVSHDRYFINRTATRILELTGQTLVNYIGNYDYYLEKKEELTRIYVTNEAERVPSKEASSESGRQDWQEQKKQQATERKRKNDLERTEQEIALLEEEKEGLSAELSDPAVATNSAHLMEIHTQLTEIEERLLALYETWEQLAEQM